MPGLLSTLSSVYNLLGLATTLIIEGLTIQKLCKENSAWDDPVPESSKDEWNIWKKKVRVVEKINVTQYFKPRT